MTEQAMIETIAWVKKKCEQEMARQRNMLLHDLQEARICLTKDEPNIGMALRRIISLEEFCEDRKSVV